VVGCELPVDYSIELCY